MIVVAGIGEQRFGQRHATAFVAIDAGMIFDAGSGDVPERAPRVVCCHIALCDLPAHASQPQLGAAVVAGCIERIEMRRSNGAMAVKALEQERRAARIGQRTDVGGDRQRHRRMDEIMGDELQQVCVARGYRRIFPMLDRWIRLRRPLDLGIHPPRQAVHQCADLGMMRRRLQGIDAEHAVALRGEGRSEEMPKSRSRCDAGIALDRIIGGRLEGCIDAACSHHGFLAAVRGQVGESAVKLS